MPKVTRQFRAEPGVLKWHVQLGLKLDDGSQTFCWKEKKNYLKIFFVAVEVAKRLLIR